MKTTLEWHDPKEQMPDESKGWFLFIADGIFGRNHIAIGYIRENDSGKKFFYDMSFDDDWEVQT